MGLKDKGEFGLIADIAARFASLVPPGTDGIGDDCAVLPLEKGESLVVTTDLLTEGVHFIGSLIRPFDLGYKSLAVNLSDVAAMGASPAGSFLSLALPEGTEEAWTEAFLEGYHALSEAFGVPLLGGDTTRSAAGATVSVTALGKARTENLKRRRDARAGDRVYVTAPLGDSAVGLKLLPEGKEGLLTDRHVRPRPHVAEGVWLGGRPEVGAMMDISDGLASDLVRMLEASGVGVEADLARIPVSSEAETVCGERGWDLLELAVAGGEDYCLLLTARPEGAAMLEKAYAARFGVPLFRIGTVVESGGLVWTRNGKAAGVTFRGFTHF